MTVVDVIVVGAGTAGSVVARRLVDAGQRVTVIEAGPGWPGPASLASIDTVAALAEDDRFWPGVVARSGSGPPTAYRQGRGVGGSSAINAVVVTSGDRFDYDRWAHDRGCAGWDGAAMEPWLARAAATMGVSDARLGPLAGAVAAAALSHGHQAGGSSLTLDASGLLAASLTASHRRRHSAADAYLGPLLETGGQPPSGPRRPALGLELVTGTGVRRLTVSHGRVDGVELGDGRQLRARRVVLCGGAIQTPLLLEASGLATSAVGRVADHPSFVFTVELDERARQPVDQPSPPISAVLRWSTEVGLRCDLMALAMDHVGLGSTGRRYGAVIVVLTDVLSTGRVLVGPDGAPIVEPGWLVEAEDRRRFRAGVRQVADLLASDALAAVATAISLDDQGTPLAHLVDLDDEQLDRWLLSHPGPVRHPAATARMGAPDDPGAVTDTAGALLGIDGLHLADASVLPHVPNANPMLPVLAVAERLAAGLS